LEALQDLFVGRLQSLLMLKKCQTHINHSAQLLTKKGTQSKTDPVHATTGTILALHEDEW